MKTKVEIKEFDIKQVVIPIHGTSPLIVHKFSEKAQKQIEGKQQGEAKNKKHAIRVPKDEFEAAKHIARSGFEGFPVGGVKKAMIRGAKMVGIVMTDARSSFFIKPDCAETNLVEIKGKSKMRTDMVRIGMGTADVRYRPEYINWRMNLKIEYNEGIISLDQLFQILKAGGFGCGIGEWRPERDGDFGRFDLTTTKK